MSLQQHQQQLQHPSTYPVQLVAKFTAFPAAGSTPTQNHFIADVRAVKTEMSPVAKVPDRSRSPGNFGEQVSVI
jgi:hypothetical protein